MANIVVSEPPSKMTKKQMRDAEVHASKMKLFEEWAKVKNKYDEYQQNPCKHPMYEKEWQIFYFRTLSDIVAGNI